VIALFLSNDIVEGVRAESRSRGTSGHKRTS